jgi:hypothetical protein
VRYELGFYIPEKGILHSHSHENLKSAGLCSVDVMFSMWNTNWVLNPRRGHSSELPPWKPRILHNVVRFLKVFRYLPGIHYRFNIQDWRTHPDGSACYLLSLCYLMPRSFRTFRLEPTCSSETLVNFNRIFQSELLDFWALFIVQNSKYQQTQYFGNWAYFVLRWGERNTNSVGCLRKSQP